jgi:hypothetical protein
MAALRHHLLHVKELADSTRLRRTTIIRALLSMTSNSTTPSVDELRQYLAQEFSRVSAASGGVTATAARSYLRFRAFEGDRVEQLLPVVAPPANWRLAPLPQTLTLDEVNRLLVVFPVDLLRISAHRACAAMPSCDTSSTSACAAAGRSHWSSTTSTGWLAPFTSAGANPCKGRDDAKPCR